MDLKTILMDEWLWNDIAWDVGLSLLHEYVHNWTILSLDLPQQCRDTMYTDTGQWPSTYHVASVKGVILPPSWAWKPGQWLSNSGLQCWCGILGVAVVHDCCKSWYIPHRACYNQKTQWVDLHPPQHTNLHISLECTFQNWPEDQDHSGISGMTLGCIRMGS